MKKLLLLCCSLFFLSSCSDKERARQFKQLEHDREALYNLPVSDYDACINRAESYISTAGAFTEKYRKGADCETIAGRIASTKELIGRIEQEKRVYAQMEAKWKTHYINTDEAEKNAAAIRAFLARYPESIKKGILQKQSDAVNMDLYRLYCLHTFTSIAACNEAIDHANSIITVLYDDANIQKVKDGILLINTHKYDLFRLDFDRRYQQLLSEMDAAAIKKATEGWYALGRAGSAKMLNETTEGAISSYNRTIHRRYRVPVSLYVAERTRLIKVTGTINGDPDKGIETTITDIESE